MKQYNFDTVLSRKGTGSKKWQEMAAYNVPDDVIPFSVADMELPVLPEVTEGLKAFLDSSPLGYCNPDDRFLQAVCSWTERRYNWTISPDMIVGTPGVVSAFFAAVRAFTQPGDGILLLTPTYYPMYMAAERNGRHYVSCPLINTDGYYTINFEELEAQASLPDVHLMILCSPHNPTGRVWTREELECIGRICIDHDVIVFSDEIHCDLIMPGYHHISFGSISEEFAHHCLVAISPSKTFNLAGLQTSNVIIPDAALRDTFLIERKTADANPKCNILGLEACRIAYTEGDEWLSQVIGVINTNRKIITDFMGKEFPSVIISPLEGTYLLWMDFRPLSIPAQELSVLLKRDAWLFFDDGSVFGAAGEGFERWNLACPTQYIQPALYRLRDALNHYLNQSNF